MIPAPEDFDGTWPFEARYFDGHGFRQHYVDEGPGDTGETFVCLHGEPTWGYLFRKFIPRLARTGRVVVPDHMGFGKSETPQDRPYTAQDHCENLAALLLDLGLENITLVMHDWGGPIGSQFALRHPGRIRRLILIDTFVQPPIPPSIDEQMRAQLRSSTPWFGLVLSEDFEAVIHNLSSTILAVLQRIGFERTGIVDDTWVRAYAAPFPTARDCIGARRFPQTLLEPETARYLGEALALPGALEALGSKPAALFMGERDRTVPFPVAEAGFRAHWPDGPLVTLPGVGHYAPEDVPDTLLAVIEQFVQLTG